MPKPAAYIGIDPGAQGALVALYGDGESVALASLKGDSSPQLTWEWLNSWQQFKVRVAIEQQVPRPTRWFDKRVHKWMSSILRSTCILFGHYCKLLGMLTAASLPYEEVPPQRWQKALHLGNREKKQTTSQWKGKLRRKAQQLYPSFSQEITLIISDALLLAHYSMVSSVSNHLGEEE